jgi:benzoylformate decarboxylase
MDSTHPLFRGALGHMFGSASTAALHGADAALVVGTYLFPEVFPSLDSPFEPAARVVHVDLDPAAIGKNHPADLGLVADPKLTLTALADRLAEMFSSGDRHEASERVHQAARVRAARPEPTDRADALDAVLRELARRAPDDLVVFDEALTVSPRVTRHLPPRRPGDYFVTRGGSLGVGIPGAVGIKLARPGSTVVAFVGDGASMYTIPALWTAARHRLDVRIVICNNGRYELLAQNIDQYWAERGIAAHPYPDSFSLAPEIGFCEIARGLGTTATRVEKPEDAEAAVDLLLGASGPSLLDVLVDPDPGRTSS